MGSIKQEKPQQQKQPKDLSHLSHLRSPLNLMLITKPRKLLLLPRALLLAMRNIKRQGLPATADTNAKSGRLKNILYHPTSGSSLFLSLFVGGGMAVNFLQYLQKKSLLIVQFWLGTLKY